MDFEYDELRRCAEQEGLLETLHGYPLKLTRVLLSTYGVEGALRKIRSMRDTLDELRGMEQAVDQEVLLRDFDRGFNCVQSKDRKGRPIFWTKARPNIRREKPPFTAMILRDLWVSVWSYRIRENLDEGILGFFDDTSRPILDFNIGFTREMARLTDGLFPVIQGEFIFFIRNSALKVIGNIATQSLNFVLESNVSFSNNREEIFSEMEDPSAYPGFFMDGGTPYTMSFDALGNWRDLVLRRKGFSNMTIADIYRPDPLKIAELRQKAAEEDAAWHQIQNALQRSPSIKAGLHYSEDSSEENESVTNANEFLM